MGRRRFDHLFVEICLLAGRPLSRYRLWLRLHETGANPESLTRRRAEAFCGDALEHFLSEEGVTLSDRERRRLRRAVRRFDPGVATPEELLAR